MCIIYMSEQSRAQTTQAKIIPNADRLSSSEATVSWIGIVFRDRSDEDWKRKNSQRIGWEENARTDGADTSLNRFWQTDLSGSSPYDAGWSSYYG